MNETFVTFHGWAGSDVRHRRAKDVSVSTFRVGVTPRLKRDGNWGDGETTWYSVTAWRALADHVADSIHKGDPVIVHGRLRTETWQPPEGPASVTLHVEASLVGHDLTRGISHYFKRPERRSDEPPTGTASEAVSENTHDNTSANATEATERPELEPQPDDPAPSGDHLAA